MFRELSKLVQEHMNFPLFGILLFTEEHPHVVKVLKDVDYYSALDKITGDEIALFATMLFPGYFISTDDERVPLSPVGESHTSLRGIWREPEENIKILRLFNIEDGTELPLLIVFGNEGGNLYYQQYPINGESTQDVYNNLKGVLTNISLSVQKAKKNGEVNKQKIFGYAKWEMKKLEAYSKVKVLFETISTFRGAVGI